ncbi:hypothetical protein IE81DRAFT_150430 [Ceraceosorus guamensis]|uniref:DUF6533 domain-containing protein n=1 Tax=Ceraceosorus guamensis TaxID=1522189 RepID=A0A316W0A6_9BASI|nr:hypothetical protein IE81DRAFT_150430 [Ceraceosorus guamensis]PWN41991.1 hypothetical protein IE81DRAFT_150430 [Ceraceosorus guamensis]
MSPSRRQMALAMAHRSRMEVDQSRLQISWINRVIHDVAVASLTLYAWEFFCTIPQEWSLYRHRKLLSPQVILFAAVRYLAIPALVLPAYSAFNDFSNDPKGCLLHQQLTIVPVQAAVAAIFSWRTCAIWGWAPKIKWGLLALFLAQIGSSFALLWYSGQKLLPTGACMPVAKPGIPNTLAWFYVTALIFDGITVGLSLWKLLELSQSGGPEEHTVRARDLCSPWILAKKLRSQWATMTPLLGRLITSGLIYLFVASAFNLINFALEISNWIHAKVSHRSQSRS